MAVFEQYVKKDGSKLWKFQSYLGVDEITGKEVRTTRRGFKTKKEAQLELNKIKLDFEKNGSLKNNNKITYFKQLYEVWYEQHHKNIKETTKQRISIHFNNHILIEFGNLKIDKITPLFCQRVLNKWAESLKSYPQLKIYTSKVFDFGILLGILSVNPMERTITPKISKTAQIESHSYYTKDELKKFFVRLEALNDDRSFAFFRLLAFTGIRKGEAMALTWGDVDFKNKTISISKTLAELKSGKPVIQDVKTSSSNRVVEVDSQTLVILSNWKKKVLQDKLSLGLRDDNFDTSVVFCNSVYYNQNQYLYKSYANNVLLRLKRKFPDQKIIKVHDFRKTHASLLFESGVSIKDVSNRLGHKSTKVTEDIYVKVTPTKKKESARKFAEYMAF